MGYEALSDPLVDALRAIAKQEVTAALDTEVGEGSPAVRETRGFPFSLDLIERAGLPAMFVHRERAAAQPTGRHGDDELVTVAFEYVGQPTPMAKLDARWPLLHRVWSELKRAVQDGLVDDVPVLCPAGVQRLEPKSPTVEYAFASDGSNAYPFFVGRMQFLWRPPTATPEYAELLELVADINRVDGDPDLQPEVQVRSVVE